MSDQVPVTSSRKVNSAYFAAGAGIIRIIIVGLGIIAITLGAIGSTNDLDSNNGGDVQSSYYGYGLGYYVEPLFILYMAFLVITWLLTIGLLILSFLSSGGKGKGRTAARVLYLITAIILLIGCVCCGIGLYNFWEGCCHVYPPGRGEHFYRPQYEAFLGYTNWCRCTIGQSGGAGRPTYVDIFQWSPELLSRDIVSAWPHHFTVHVISHVLSVVNAILCFVATCLA